MYAFITKHYVDLWTILNQAELRVVIYNGLVSM